MTAAPRIGPAAVTALSAVYDENRRFIAGQPPADALALLTVEGDAA